MTIQKLDDIKKPQLSKVATTTRKAAARIQKAENGHATAIWDAVDAVADVLTPFIELPEDARDAGFKAAINYAKQVWNTACTQMEVPDADTKHFKRHLSNMLWARSLPQDTEVKDQDGRAYTLATLPKNVGILQRSIADAKAAYGHASAAKKATKKGPDQNRKATPEEAYAAEELSKLKESKGDIVALKSFVKDKVVTAEGERMFIEVFLQLGYKLQRIPQTAAAAKKQAQKESQKGA